MAGFSVVLKAPTSSLFFFGGHHHHYHQKQQKTLVLSSSSSLNILQTVTRRPCRLSLSRSSSSSIPINIQSPTTTTISATQQIEKRSSYSSSSLSSSLNSQNLAFPIMVNGCTGKMGKSVIEAEVSAGLQVVPISFGRELEAGQIVLVGGKEIHVHGPSDRESVLASVFDKYPNMIVVDFTVPTAVNGK
ncbi:Dihydrodipicolinate reductase [Macleaya cordata]|uniref:Dihydrodipicolinate reductase n=1 Tax=Macleaya cordata TaxID=56857 RepID=A0A200RDZ9_MACCD|nr:Dihydrodipicolinate reductase [Macleaya cordata]